MSKDILDITLNSFFHCLHPVPACLRLENSPVGDWRCSNCNDRKADLDSSNSSKPIVIRLTRVVKNAETVCGGCVLCRLVALSDL